MSRIVEGRRGRMLIGRSRLFYCGLVGNSMKARRHGALTIYAATDACFHIKVGRGHWQSRRVIALEPFTAHRLWSPSGYISNICIEVERVDRLAIEKLITETNDGSDGARLAHRVLAAWYEVAAIADAGGFSTQEFDRHFLCQTLPPRELDPRIRRIFDLSLDDQLDQALSADACAAKVGLSTSRFLHLFKENAGIPFRSLRSWKRARRFLVHASHDTSLTDVALDLGYPDSSHFSHSIRATFGLKPRTIRDGARGIQVCFGEDYAIGALRR